MPLPNSRFLHYFQNKPHHANFTPPALSEDVLENRYYPTQPDTAPSALELAWRKSNLAKDAAGTAFEPVLRLVSANPFRDHLDFIVEESSVAREFSFELFDGNGRLLINRTRLTTIEGSTLRIEGLGYLPKGSYHYRFIDRNSGAIYQSGSVIKQ